MLDPQGTLAKGYALYKDSYYKVSSYSTEYVIVSDRDKIAEYLAAPEDVLSFKDTVNQLLQTEWTMGYGVAHRQYHVALVRSKLTQSIGTRVPAMQAEIELALDSLVGSPTGEASIAYMFQPRTKAKMTGQRMGRTRSL